MCCGGTSRILFEKQIEDFYRKNCIFRDKKTLEPTWSKHGYLYRENPKLMTNVINLTTENAFSWVD